MQNQSVCLIEQSLLNIRSSARSKQNLLSFLSTLQSFISRLLDGSLEAEGRLEKNNELFAFTLIDQAELKSLLEILGFHEDSLGFSFQLTDENMIKLQQCLRFLHDLIKEQDSVLKDISNYEDELHNKKPQGHSSSSEKLRSKEGSSGRLKDILLSKHMKKEHSNDLPSKRSSSKSSDFAFNTNGYFHQSGNKSDRTKNRSFIREVFHQPDHEIRGWTSSNQDAKLI